MFRSFQRSIKYSRAQALLFREKSVFQSFLCRSPLTDLSRQASSSSSATVAVAAPPPSTVTPNNTNDTTAIGDASTTTELASSSRNKALAEIIRGGFHALNQVAVDIQASPVTLKSIFSPPDEPPSPRQKAEEHLIYTTATACLEQLAKQGKLCVHGDPIVILDVELKKGAKLAVLYWCLPFDVLADDETLTARDKQILEFRMHNVLTNKGGAQLLQRGIHAALSHYYPPRIRLDPAPDELLLKTMKDILE